MSAAPIQVCLLKWRLFFCLHFKLFVPSFLGTADFRNGISCILIVSKFANKRCVLKNWDFKPKKCTGFVIPTSSEVQSSLPIFPVYKILHGTVRSSKKIVLQGVSKVFVIDVIVEHYSKLSEKFICSAIFSVKGRGIWNTLFATNSNVIWIINQLNYFGMGRGALFDMLLHFLVQITGQIVLVIGLCSLQSCMFCAEFFCLCLPIYVCKLILFFPRFVFWEIENTTQMFDQDDKKNLVEGMVHGNN